MKVEAEVGEDGRAPSHAVPRLEGEHDVLSYVRGEVEVGEVSLATRGRETREHPYAPWEDGRVAGVCGSNAYLFRSRGKSAEDPPWKGVTPPVDGVDVYGQGLQLDGRQKGFQDLTRWLNDSEVPIVPRTSFVAKLDVDVLEPRELNSLQNTHGADVCAVSVVHGIVQSDGEAPDVLPEMLLGLHGSPPPCSILVLKRPEGADRGPIDEVQHIVQILSREPGAIAGDET